MLRLEGLNSQPGKNKMSNKSNGVKMKDNDYLQFVSTCEYNTLIRL